VIRAFFGALLVYVSIVKAASFDFSGNGSGNADAIPAALVKGAEAAFDINKRGLDALERGQLDSAANCFSKAQSLLPVYSDAQNNAGVVQFRRGNVGQAVALWRAVIAQDPTYEIANYNLGVAAFDEQKFDESYVLFSKAALANKQFTEAILMLGRTELALDKKAEAITHFRAAYKTAPSQAETWQFLSFALVTSGDTAGAQAILQKHQDNNVALKMLGQIAFGKKDFKAASEYYTKAVAKGGSADLLLELAMSRLDASDCKAALAVLKQYFAKTSQPLADGFLYQGLALKDCGDDKGATSAFENGLAKFPGDQILRYNLGQMYYHVRQFDKAENMWSTVADSLDDPSLAYLRGLNARRKGDLDKAEEYIRSALRRDERAEYCDALGAILYAKGKKDDAVLCFKRALKIDPALRSAQLNLALTTQSKDDLERSAMELQKSFDECKEKCQDAALQLSIVLYHMARFDDAAKTIERIPDAEKGEKLFRHLALYYRELHDWDKSIQTLEKARSILVLDVQTEYELAEDYMLSGNSQKAIDMLIALLGKWDQNPWRIDYQLGYVYMEQKEFVKAKKYLQLSLKSKPDNAAAQGLMAYIYNAEGNVSQARTLWEKTLRDDPNNYNLLVNMALSLEKDGRFDEAMQYYQKALLIKFDDNSLQINIGNVYNSLDKPVEAMKAYTLGLKSPQRQTAAFNIFLLAQKRGLAEKTNEMLAILTSEFASSPLAARAQADALLAKQDTAAALVKLEQLAVKDPGDLLILARIYGARKNSAKAMQYLASVPQDVFWDKAKTGVRAQIAYVNNDFAQAFLLWKSLGDTSTAVQYNMALAAYNVKNYDAAFALAEALVAKVNGIDRADVCRLAGNSAMAQKDWPKALRWYQQLENIRQNDALVEYNLAIINYNLNKMDDSWACYQKARTIDHSIENKDIEKRYQGEHASGGSGIPAGDSIDNWYNDAVTLQNDGKDTAAELLYKRVVEKTPAYYHAWNNLGAIYAGRGVLDTALDCYLKSIEKQHDMPEAYANLVNVYIAMENFKEAQRWIVKGRGHNPDSELLKDLEQKVKLLVKKK